MPIFDASDHHPSPKTMQRLAKWMHDNERTQAWIAEQCGVKQPTVSAWLRGEMNPTVDNLKKLSALTLLTIDQLVGNELVA